MDSVTSTEDLRIEEKSTQENILLEIIKELCYEDKKISAKLRGKVNRIIADCDLTHHSSLHKLSTADASTSSLLGFMHQTPTELTFDEQQELNQAIIQSIESKLPPFIAEMESLKQTLNSRKTRKDQMRELQQSLNEKLDSLQEQQSEKVELMMEWLNHRLQDVTKFYDNSSELLKSKTKIFDLKSKILHLQVLQNIFTETNQSIKAYSEIHKDLKDSIRETEQRMKQYREIIESDL